MSLCVGILEVELLLPGANSLKEKRRVLRSVLDRLVQKYQVSVAETGYQNKWGRALIGIAGAGSDRARMVSLLQKIEEELLDHPQMEMIQCFREVI